MICVEAGGCGIYAGFSVEYVRFETGRKNSFGLETALGLLCRVAILAIHYRLTVFKS